jgi:uncharacterized delta-60 repeat protein
VGLGRLIRLASMVAAAVTAAPAGAATMTALQPAPAGTALVAEGDLDPTFNGTGKVVTLIGQDTSFDSINSLLIDPAGRIVAIGQSGAPGHAFAIARYRPNGGLDASFNDGGITGVDIGPDSADRAGTIDHQGRIVAVGIAGHDFALARFRPDGTLDPSFNSTGTLDDPISGIQDEAKAVVTDAQDRIVACGATVGTTSDFGIVRYNVNGTRDQSFGTHGVVKTDFGGNVDTCFAVAIDAQGRIVAAGNSEPLAGPTAQLAVARYLPNGGLDPTFGSGGKEIVPMGASGGLAQAVAIDGQGRIVLIGAGMVRLMPNGALDQTFGSGGKVLGGGGAGVAIDPQGRIITAGSVSGDFLISRYLPNGMLDPKFNGNGQVVTAVGQNSSASSVAIDAQSRIVAGGYGTTGSSSNDHFALVRLIGDATPPIATITSGPTNGSFTNQRRPRFTFTSSEAGSTFSCRVDLLALSVCASPYLPGVSLADGAHTFGVVAIDRAGNQSAQVTRTFTVDTEPPRITIHHTIKGRRATFKIKTTEPLRSLKCALGKARAKTCGFKYTSRELKPGTHVLRVTATDRAGNITRATDRFTIHGRRHH